MSEQLEEHYTLMKSGWRIDRSDPSGEVFYYPTKTVHPVKMILEDAYKMEKILQKWSEEK